MAASRKKTKEKNLRTPEQIAQDRIEYAELKSQGYREHEIVSYFHDKGRTDYTDHTAAGDWRAIRRDWAAESAPQTLALVREELHANDIMLKQSWRNYREAMIALEGIDYVAAMNEDLAAPAPVDPEEPQPRRRTGPRIRRTDIALKARRQAFNEVATWWRTIEGLRASRARLLGLTAANFVLNIDNRDQKVLVTGKDGKALPEPLPALPEKIYIGFDPDMEWPDPLPRGQKAADDAAVAEEDAVVEGEFDDAADS